MFLWILAAFCAFFVKGLCGFANTLVFDTILGFGVNNVNISPVELVLGYPTNVILTFKNREKIDKNIVIPLIIVVIAGSLPGAFVLRYVNANIVKMIFGVMVALVGIDMMYREYKPSAGKSHKLFDIVIGILAGAMCGMFGVGVLLAAFVSKVTKTSTEFKANLSLVFIAENTFRLVTYIVLGVMTFDSLIKAICLAPVMLFSLWLGMKCGDILDEKLIKKLVILFLIISGVAMIVNNLNGRFCNFSLQEYLK
ncbi:MAG: sulfite exporter TauE/SafE family protein [Pseudobutyrivibrio ruminis]|uniref:sulfite exporter TauE/SafE family protein n=1 Tax=Pseudobutyrivibrio ruminis TaxID=46206 RepID=UPI0026EC4A81|nr:sulfite exporter TauE/SafE family protein [Pseudobutyrivibrio ruminis]MBE5914165.1 sulfite exporter TauE/SafE family protein [Pseudobutyrivibrio ruminis]